MLPKTEIEKSGGKGAILSHIRDNTDLPVPRYVIKEAGQGLDSIMQEFNAMTKPVIVRSSSPYEYGAFEGIFESVRDVMDANSLLGAVRTIELSATSERAEKYAEQNGFKIDEKMSVIVQEQSPSLYCGAMMRHPNNPDLVFITFFGANERFRGYKHFAYSEKINGKTNLSGFVSARIDEEDAKFLVEQYKKIESLERITDDKVLFVEFGFNPFAVYQARPFKKIETADFEVPEWMVNNNLRFGSDFVFGITPKEGIVLPVLRSLGVDEAFSVMRDLTNKSESEYLEFKGQDMILRMHLRNAAHFYKRDAEGEEMLRETMRNWHFESEGALERKPYALVTASVQRDGYDTDISVPNMEALILGSTDTFLVHRALRMFKQAKVTLGYHTSLLHCPFYKEIESVEDKVRIISNGKEGIAIRE